jgi:hypothetical protein
MEIGYTEKIMTDPSDNGNSIKTFDPDTAIKPITEAVD